MQAQPILPILGFRWLEKLIGPYADRRIILMLFLGFSCGLPLTLALSTVGTWLADVGIDKKTIGLTALIGLPYTLKPLWAPLLDGTSIPILSRMFGRRRSWILVAQASLIVSIIMLSQLDPLQGVTFFMLTALLIAFCSASQDIVVDAYRIERIEPDMQAAALALYQMGYRGAMWIAGAGALVMADFFQRAQSMEVLTSWQTTFFVVAVLAGVGICATLCAAMPESDRERLEKAKARRASKEKEAKAPALIRAAKWFRDYYVEPFIDFTKRAGWLHILIFVALFRLADAYIGVMVNPFLLDVGFTLSQIAVYVKTYGLFATMAGVLVGGVLVVKFGIYRVLIGCSILHMFTNLMFVILATSVEGTVAAGEVPSTESSWILIGSIISQNGTAGMTSGAFMAYLSSLCNLRFAATQYALLTSLAAIGRNLVAATSGVMADLLGWAMFFAFSSLLAIPALSLLWYINRRFMVGGPNPTPSEVEEKPA